MKKIFTILAVAAAVLSANAAVEVTYNGAPVADGAVIKLDQNVLHEIEGIPGYEMAEHFTINGATPIELNVTADNAKWQYCTNTCFTLLDETGEGKEFTHYSTINTVPQDLAVDANFIMEMEIPKVDMNITFELTGSDDSTLTFTVNLNTNDNAVKGILNDADAQVSVYNLQGVKMTDPSQLPAGVYIRRQGSKAEKFIVK